MRILVFLIGLYVCLIAGCQNDSSKISPAEQIVQLRQQNTQLTEQLKTSQSLNRVAAEQIETLSQLSTDERLKNIYQTKKIRITRYTNIFDKNKDSLYEKLIVYIKPIDQDGDIVKATGDVDIQLWNLDKTGDEALMGEWNISADQLKKLWIDTIVTINYRLEFDLNEEIEKPTTPLTVKVVFTDYITGKTFTEQKIIKP